MTIISSLPVTLQNGTLADANQVMADLNAIQSQVNSGAAALAGGNAFTGTQTVNGETVATLVSAANSGYSATTAYSTSTIGAALQRFGNATDFGTLALAFASYDTIFVTTANYPVTANTTIASTKSLIFLAGGSLSISTGVTLTINCEIQAPLRAIFNGSGSVVGIRQVCPEWFGAAGNGATDDIAALNAAHTCIQGSLASAGGRPTIFLKSPSYGVSSTWSVTPTSNINLAVEGGGTIFSGSRIVPLSSFSVGGPVVQINGSSGGTLPITDFRFRDIGIVPSAGGAGTATIGLQVGSNSSTLTINGQEKSLIENVFISGFTTNWNVIHCRLIKFLRCSGWNQTFLTANTNLQITQLGGVTADLEFDACQFVASGAVTAGIYNIAIVSNNAAYNPATGANQVGGIKFVNCDAYLGTQSVRLFAGNGSWITDIWFEGGCELDGLCGTRFYIESQNTGANIQNVHITHNYIAACNTNHVTLTSTGTGGSFSDIWIDNNWMDRAGAQTIVAFAASGAGQGVHVHHNSLSNPLYTTGPMIDFNGILRFTCDHNVVTQDGTSSSAKYMVEVDSGCNHFSVNNNVSGGLMNTAVLLDNSGAVTKIVTPNI